MIGIAVLINAILLPVLATLGVFKAKRGSQNIDVKLIKLAPEKKVVQKKTPPKKLAKAKPRPPTPGRHQATRLATHPSAPNPNQPKLVAAAGGNGNGPEIDNNGTGQAGVVNTPPPATTPAPVAEAPPPAVQPVPQPKPAPVVTPPAPSPPAPVYSEAEPQSQPQPEIPDDLAGQELHATFWGLFTVHPDGSAEVKMVKSTGNSELDDAALAAARRWTFKPGAKDGTPVESYRRLRIDIDVS